MTTETSNPGGENPSAILLRELLSPKLAACPNQVYRLTPYESELLAQSGRERRAIMQRMIAEGFLDNRMPTTPEVAKQHATEPSDFFEKPHRQTERG